MNRVVLRRVLGTIAVAVFVLANGTNALRKGGDFRVYVEAGQRVIDGRPMYEGSGVGGGAIGPPFQAVFFTPFAALARWNFTAARLAWYGVNLVCLVLAVRWWVMALDPVLQFGSTSLAHTVTSSRVVVPLLAVAFPLQTNFEHQNLNVLLLALVGAAALAALRAQPSAAGALIGGAAALKAFPAFLMLPSILCRKWRVAVVAATVAIVLSVVPAARYGMSGYADLVARWRALSASGDWPIRGNNQSLFAAVARYFGSDGLWAAGSLDVSSHRGVYLLWGLLALAVLAGFVWSWRRALWSERDMGTAIPVSFAASLLVAILLSPIAWDHYWVLSFPAFLACYNAPLHAGRGYRAVFWIAAIATSGVSRILVGADGLALARAISTFTWSAILLLIAMVTMSQRLREVQ
jgi:hypothetical protein